MTIAMPDSVNVNDLPAGYPAYLGYVDGDFPTGRVLPGLFPEAQLVLLTVKGGTALAHGARVAPGADTEPGDLTAGGAAGWAASALAAAPAYRPVLYASIQGMRGYGMPDLVAELATWRISRPQVRLLSAHYTGKLHICGPTSCGATPIGMDGTQWTDSYRTAAGTLIDMSALRDDFFDAPAPTLTGTEKIVQQLGIVRQGDDSEIVRTVQGLLCARNQSVAIDGVFGPATAYAVRSVQNRAGLELDGVVGPLTWPVLLGVA